jgi:hypothetical protein
MICLNPVQDDNDCVKRGLFLFDNDLYNELTQKKFREILLTDATTEDGEDEVATYFKVKNSGMNYWISGMKKERSLLVSNGITSYYFLSNQQVKWTIYGLASSRLCITMQQQLQVLSVLNSIILPTNFNQDHSLWKIFEMEILSLSRNCTLQILTIWTRSCQKKSMRQCF